ncbi:carbon starvation protein A [Saccharicrinis sp. FJH54]|uniref:carbon starvation CstA family protein n=1 Tax=Saccharicrinis sp. FJH54 TaxID=3344665 RepID=UPI0035D4CEFB
MEVLVLMLLTFGGYIAAYHLYGKFLSRKIFKINPASNVPSHNFQDGVDFVPSKKKVVFGHHFTSIAGTGPIVGPAVAIIWGWVPALIWVFLGSIFMGAVHDFGSLVISLRNQGKSISDYTARYMHRHTRFLLFLVVFLELWIVIAIFGLVIAIIFNMFPASVFPVFMQIAIAVWLGRMINTKGRNINIYTAIAVLLMFATIIAGVYLPFKMPGIAGIPATGVWTIVLLIYAFIASVLPVSTLLQPRDFINAYQLIVVMILLVGGVIAAAFSTDLSLVAPAISMDPKGAPKLFPFLFITIACGAISGFHSVVSSGTSAKQLDNEKDALFVGYGSMLMEGTLALLVLIAVAAGIGLGYKAGDHTLTGISAWNSHYASWQAVSGLGSKLNAFVVGSSNMIGTLGVPYQWALAVMGVFIASFAGTTLDTATRLQRYVISEVFTGVKPMQNKWLATFIAVLTAAVLAFANGADGNGALSLWPLFGAVNQTLAALALIVITLYLKKKGKYFWMVSGLPAIFMSVMTIWALLANEKDFWGDKNWLLVVVNFLVIAIASVITLEGFGLFLLPERHKEIRSEKA